ncbi:ADP-ribose pyrophosphatase [Candidatus Mancarchaeum acidiphilum]|uniref:ADP-ribose pyrophosphatase n=2 Tax=Candidatus Mancarchaeum acidiphilum TaxID=1920749 RepID=A0A218NMN9_9ARCH|nr:ADP-ribose pyrophosphatase [Candidatus Mancarchaeum acidiphilum]
MISMRKYHSVKFDVVEEKVKLPNGTEYISSIVVHKPVAVIIPVLNGKILIERQYRHSPGGWMYELPAGFLQGKITLEGLAKKELHEETGYIADKLTFLFKAYAAPGTSTEMYYYYLAENFRKEKQHLEKYEIIKTRWTSIEQLLNMIKKNRITDGKTIIGILYYYNFCKVE